MTLLFILLFCVYLVGLAAVVGAASRAPEGFEDEDGFHTGRSSVRDESA